MTRKNSTLITKIQRAFVVFKINLRTVVCFNKKVVLTFQQQLKQPLKIQFQSTRKQT